MYTKIVSILGWPSEIHIPTKMVGIQHVFFSIKHDGKSAFNIKNAEQIALRIKI